MEEVNLEEDDRAKNTLVVIGDSDGDTDGENDVDISDLLRMVSNPAQPPAFDDGGISVNSNDALRKEDVYNKNDEVEDVDIDEATLDKRTTENERVSDSSTPISRRSKEQREDKVQLMNQQSLQPIHVFKIILLYSLDSAYKTCTSWVV